MTSRLPFLRRLFYLCCCGIWCRQFSSLNKVEKKAGKNVLSERKRLGEGFEGYLHFTRSIRNGTINLFEMSPPSQFNNSNISFWFACGFLSTPSNFFLQIVDTFPIKKGKRWRILPRSSLSMNSYPDSLSLILNKNRIVGAERMNLG